MQQGQRLDRSAEEMKKVPPSDGRSWVEVPANALRKKKFEEAETLFRNALKLFPRETSALYELGNTLYTLERYPDAIKLLSRARRGDLPSEKAYELSFRLAIAYSKLGRFDMAVREYDKAERALSLGNRGTNLLSSSSVSSRDRWSRALVNANAAESLMTMGRLEEAIARYRQALSYYPGYRLALWGLGVALDRDEQLSEAMSVIAKAIASDATMQELRKPDVFFIPAGDAHYYFALGYESAGNYRDAQRQWRAFLEKLPKSPWAFRARWHLGRANAGSGASQKKQKRLAPTPRMEPSKDALLLAYRERIYRRLSYSHYRMRDCYRRTVKKHPKAQGKLRLLFSIDEKGRPLGITTESKSLRQPLFRTCMVELLRRKSFAQPPGGITVKIDYPVTFKLN